MQEWYNSNRTHVHAERELAAAPVAQPVVKAATKRTRSIGKHGQYFLVETGHTSNVYFRPRLAAEKALEFSSTNRVHTGRQYLAAQGVKHAKDTLVSRNPAGSVTTVFTV